MPGERVRFPLTPALRTETGPILGTSTHTFASMAFGTGDGLANRIFDATTVSPVTYPVLVSVTSQTGGRLLHGRDAVVEARLLTLEYCVVALILSARMAQQADGAQSERLFERR